MAWKFRSHATRRCIKIGNEVEKDVTTTKESLGFESKDINNSYFRGVYDHPWP